MVGLWIGYGPAHTQFPYLSYKIVYKGNLKIGYILHFIQERVQQLKNKPAYNPYASAASLVHANCSASRIPAKLS